jgi:hypothetical protein
LSWRFSFGLIFIISLVVFFLSFRMKSVPRQKGISIDLVGVVLSALSIALILFGFNNLNCVGDRGGKIGGADLDSGAVACALHAAAWRGVRPGVLCLVGTPRGVQEDAAAGAGSAGHTGGAQRSLCLSRGGRASARRSVF